MNAQILLFWRYDRHETQRKKVEIFGASKNGINYYLGDFGVTANRQCGQ